MPRREKRTRQTTSDESLSCHILRTIDLDDLFRFFPGTGGISVRFQYGSDLRCNAEGAAQFFEIEDNFLSGWRESVTEVDLSGCINLQTIGHGFLSYTSSLRSVKLTGLKSLKRIGSGFLRGCNKLTDIDLSFLRTVESIGASFLEDCSSVAHLDTGKDASPLKLIPDFFGWRCTSLVSFDSQGLTSVSTLGQGFLAQCSSLTSVDLSGFQSLNYINRGTMNGCSRLSSVDLSPLLSVSVVGRRFLVNCSSLQTIVVGRGQQNTFASRAVVEQCPDEAECIVLPCSPLLASLVFWYLLQEHGPSQSDRYCDIGWCLSHMVGAPLELGCRRTVAQEMSVLERQFVAEAEAPTSTKSRMFLTQRGPVVN